MTHKDKLNKIVDILELCMKVYFIIIILAMVYNAKVHPEFFNVLKERPVKEVSNGIDLKQANGIYTPEWMYQASTISECKPLEYFSSFYHTWLLPFIYLIILYSVLALLVKYWDKIKELIEKEDEQKENIQKDKEN